MMKVKCTTDGNRLVYEWDGKLDFSKKNSFYILYPEYVNLDNVPEHIKYFMFGIITSEILSWNDTIISVPYLVKDEETVLNDCIHRNHRINRYKRCKDEHGSIESDGYEMADTLGAGSVVCLNGMGKDGCCQILMIDEIGMDVHSVTVGNQYKTINAWDRRIKLMGEFCKEVGVDYSLVDTDFMRTFNFKVIPWFAFALPLAYHFDTRYVSIANECSFNMSNADDYIIVPSASIFYLRDLSEACNIVISSPTTPIFTYGVQKLMMERYEKYLKYQQSCMFGNPCGKCAKCWWYSIFADCIVKDGHELVGLPRYNGKFPGLSPFVEEVNNPWKKYKGLKYDDFFDRVAEPCFDIIWMGDEIRNIMIQHFDIFDRDIFIKEKNVHYKVHQWKEWMENGKF